MTSPGARRLFVATPLARPARDACANAARRLRAAGVTDARYIEAATYHVTMVFLGNVPNERFGAVTAAVAKAAAATPAFALALETIGGFPSARRATSIWAGPRETPPPFATLFGAVRRALMPIGFRFERGPRAHVTLARSRGTAVPDVAFGAPVAVEIDALTVYESLATPSGTRYVALARSPLAAAATDVPG